ncbi:MAG TPA: Gfo/Idh/MocA family oxidoreductase [Bryobacteraceae bacterium]|jgi:predicted dehydrogenase
MSTNRRDFLKTAATATTAIGMAASPAFAAKSAKASSRVIGANDRINVAVIGVGGRGTYVSRKFAEVGVTDGADKCQIVAVCDCYQKRINKSREFFAAKFKPVEGYLDYREVLNRSDVDAVIVATPDHWHAPVALAAMDAGKDVYLEKPMCHTIEEAKKLSETVKETKRVLQVGSQTTSADQWAKAKKAIADGMIGQMIMSQGSYHRNSTEGEWNYKIDEAAGPDKKGEDYIDWKMWLGNAPKRPWDPDRFFRFRKFWDYSGGIATDLFFHVVAPMNICWDKPQFPSKVVAGGGIYVFKDTREVPDTFHLIGDYPAGHSLVLSSSMANSQHIPGLIRGHEGTIIMVDNGMFESQTDHVTVKPEGRVINQAYKDKYGTEAIRIPVDQTDIMAAHINNFLDCMRSRQKPTLDVDTGAHAQVLITMAVDSYRQGKVLYFDERTWKVSDKPVKA